MSVGHILKQRAWNTTSSMLACDSSTDGISRCRKDEDKIQFIFLFIVYIIWSYWFLSIVAWSSRLATTSLLTSCCGITKLGTSLGSCHQQKLLRITWIGSVSTKGTFGLISKSWGRSYSTKRRILTNKMNFHTQMCGTRTGRRHCFKRNCLKTLQIEWWIKRMPYLLTERVGSYRMKIGTGLAPSTLE